MSITGIQSEVPYMDVADDMDFLLGMDLDLNNLYSTSPLPDNNVNLSGQWQSGQTIPTPRSTRSRAPLACVQCRSRHLRCDGSVVCSRCHADRIQCVYTKSRRGGKRRRKTSHDPHMLTSGLGQDKAVIPDITSRTAALPQVTETTLHTDSSQSTDIRTVRTAEDASRCLDLYYERFHPSHPIVIPQHHMKLRMQNSKDSVRELILVMESIGAVYQAGGSLDSKLGRLYDTLSVDLHRTGFSVQALLLYAVTMHYFDDHELAEMILSRAAELALSIEMLSRDWAVVNGENDVRLQESWRRTAWFLFNTDAVFAAIRHQPAHALQNTLIDVDLPCEDHEYESGVRQSFKIMLSLFLKLYRASPHPGLYKNMTIENSMMKTLSSLRLRTLSMRVA